jgi:two-component system phosphate regulon sensor histidine kinase PhoR
MELLHKCTASELAVIFEANQTAIIEEWRQQAALLLRDLALDKPTLTDHLPNVIAEITRDLALGRTGALSAEHTRGSPPAHGVQRFYDGLDVGEVVAEYNLLRIAFITIAEHHDVYIVGEAAHIINHRIDEAVRMAVMAFAAQQALIRKEREDEHLAFIAHDLRTPLNAVALLTSELKSVLDQTALAEAGELIAMMERNLHRLATLIKRVMDANVPSSPDATSFSPERRTFELWPLVQLLVLDLRPISSRQFIDIVNEIPHSLTVFADAGLISQVFQNLLGNAFTYASHGRVVLSARAESGTVFCTVSDNGAGIPPDLLGTIFDKLATDPLKSGTGLGLAIVKQIVEAHGGTVSAHSIEGSGATFTFTLPAPSEQLAPAG